MAGTVQGTSDLALAAVDGDADAIILATLGYTAGVLFTLGSLLVSLQPIARDHGRRLALTAAIIGMTSPLSATLLSAAGRALV